MINNDIVTLIQYVNPHNIQKYTIFKFAPHILKDMTDEKYYTHILNTLKHTDKSQIKPIHHKYLKTIKEDKQYLHNTYKNNIYNLELLCTPNYKHYTLYMSILHDIHQHYE